MPTEEGGVKSGWWSVVWIWLKQHWYLILMVGLAVWAWFFWKRKSEETQAMLSLYQRQSDDYKRQLDEIRKIRDEERRRQAQIEQTYQETLETIRRDHAEQVKLLNAQKKAEIRKIIEETNGGDPDLLAKRINDLFGIPIYESRE